MYQTWFATQTRAVSGTVTGDGVGLPGVSVEIVDGTGAVVGTATTAADGTYAVDGLAPGTYTVRVVTPDGYSPDGPTERPADPTGGDVSGVDFAFTGPADLSMIKTVDTAPVIAGQTLHYTLTASNAGPAAANGVSVTDTIPAGLTGVSGQVSGGAACTLTGSTLTCAVGSLANGDSVTVTVTGQVPANATPGAQLINTATITGDQVDSAPGNNKATVASTIAASADLAMVKTFTPAVPLAGQPVTYQLTATNAGPSSAKGAGHHRPAGPGSEIRQRWPRRRHRPRRPPGNRSATN